MFKQIYDKSNGFPILIQSNEEGNFEYDEFLYTEIIPPSNVYDPKYFDGNEWIGTSKEEWESNQSKPPVEPNDNDFLNAQLISNDMEHNAKIEALQQDIGKLTTELLEIKGGISDVSDT